MNLLTTLPVRIATYLCVAVMALTPAWAGDLKPRLDVGNGGQCVEDPEFMRSNHMKLIMHQRDDTMRQGIRGGKHSLTECVSCHAGKVDNRVIGSNQAFCQGCHVYAAVKIDCFECHSSKRKVKELAVASAMQTPAIQLPAEMKK